MIPNGLSVSRSSSSFFLPSGCTDGLVTVALRALRDLAAEEPVDNAEVHQRHQDACGGWRARAMVRSCHSPHTEGSKARLQTYLPSAETGARGCLFHREPDHLV